MFGILPIDYVEHLQILISLKGLLYFARGARLVVLFETKINFQ